MKLVYSLFLIVCIAFLTSCTTTTEPAHYYSLSLLKNNQATTISTRQNQQLPKIAIGPIHLSSFLRQEGLVMQLGEHQLYTANYHLWAEPLEEAINKRLVNQLNQLNKDYHFVLANHHWNNNILFNLRLEFENFHATDSAKIISSGQYWLYDQNKQIKLNEKFNISDVLIEDGYLHSVEKLKQSLTKLSQKISTSISENNKKDE